MHRLLLPFVLLLAAGCHDGFEAPPPMSDAPEPNMRMGELRRLWQGRPLTVHEAVVVRGTVTSSDEEGNFHHSLVLDDGTGAIEILAAENRLYALYPTGTTLTASLQGFRLGASRGMLRIGREGSDGEPAALASRVELDRLLTPADTDPAPAGPIDVTPDRLSPDLGGRLVRIAGIRLLPADETGRLPGRWSGSLRFGDDRGATFEVYTSPYARYADRPVPTGSVTLTGILQYDGRGYGIKMRHESDCTPH